MSSEPGAGQKGTITFLQPPSVRLEDTVELSLDTFRTQRVLCYRNKWVSRQEVIKYVANKASGVHSQKANDESDKILSHIRSGISLRLKPEGGIHLDMFPKGIDVDDDTFRHQPDAIDPVFIELLAAATFLVNSPFVHELEKVIQEELRVP